MVGWERFRPLPRQSFWANPLVEQAVNKVRSLENEHASRIAAGESLHRLPVRGTSP